jgi:hypothetical protein
MISKLILVGLMKQLSHSFQDTYFIPNTLPLRFNPLQSLQPLKRSINISVPCFYRKLGKRSLTTRLQLSLC